MITFNVIHLCIAVFGLMMMLLIYYVSFPSIREEVKLIVSVMKSDKFEKTISGNLIMFFGSKRDDGQMRDQLTVSQDGKQVNFVWNNENGYAQNLYYHPGIHFNWREQRLFFKALRQLPEFKSQKMLVQEMVSNFKNIT